MAPTKLTAHMSTGGKRQASKQVARKVIRKSARIAVKSHEKQLKEKETAVIQLDSEEEEKYNPGKEIKTEDLPKVSPKSVPMTDPNENLSVAQERVSLVKSLICKTAALEAEALKKDASLEQLRREMLEMKNTMEAEKQSFQSRLDQRKTDSDAITQRLAQEARRLREENLELKQKVVSVEAEKRSFLISLRQAATLSQPPQIIQPSPVTKAQLQQVQSQTIKVAGRESTKMLVILKTGELRLITFGIPKETCTVLEVLEEIGIQVAADSSFECVEIPGSEIDYLVKVGNFANSQDTATLTKAAENHVRQQRALQKLLLLQRNS